jgi:hypothetical protein
MKSIWLTIFAVLFVTPVICVSQVPSGSTGQCKDGSYTSAAKKSGACSGHKGVQTWYVTSSKPASLSGAPPSVAPESQPEQTAPADTKATAKRSSTSSIMQPAFGGGPGLVWVNTSSKIYHCEGTAYYGKTKTGKYMSEADAKAMGAHADHGRACSK